MPAVAMLNDAERAALIAYLFNDARPPATTPSASDPAADVVYTHTGYNRFLDPQGYPAVAPPWGTLNAIDLISGEIAWPVPLGEFPELTKRGMPPTGTENYGGPVVTGSGLVFIGATKDEKFRAFDDADRRSAVGDVAARRRPCDSRDLRRRRPAVHRHRSRRRQGDEVRRRIRGVRAATVAGGLGGWGTGELGAGAARTAGTADGWRVWAAGNW